MMTQFQSFFTLDHILQISISIGILAAFLVLRKLFVKYFFQLIYKLANKPKTDIFKQIAVAFDKPARWFFVALGLFLAIEYSPFLDGQMDIVKKLYRSLIVALIAWGLCNLTSASSFYFIKSISALSWIWMTFWRRFYPRCCALSFSRSASV